MALGDPPLAPVKPGETVHVNSPWDFMDDAISMLGTTNTLLAQINEKLDILIGVDTPSEP